MNQVQTSATYAFPDPGHLDKRIEIRQRLHTPGGASALESAFPKTFRRWAKVVQVGVATYQASVQIGTTVTHYITVRHYRNQRLTTDQEVVFAGMLYRIQRVRDLNSKGRFLLLECEELGVEQKA